MPTRILVTGATGKQGGAVIRALRAQSNAPILRAMTRNLDSHKARELRQQGIEVVKGSFSDVESMKQALTGVSGAFLMSMVASKNDLPEEQQGLNFIEAAKATNLPFLVFTSVSDATTTCGVHHFETKARIEIALRESGIPHAIVAPAALYDNFTRRHSWANFGALGFFETGLQGGKVQMTAADDVGDIATQMLLNPTAYTGRRIDLAGDCLSMTEVQRAYSNLEGKPVRKAAVPAIALKLLPHDAQQMFRWFRTDGFTVDIDALRKEFPHLRSFDQWLREDKVAARNRQASPFLSV